MSETSFKILQSKGSKINQCGLYWCYLKTFAGDKYVVHSFLDGTNEPCIVVEEACSGDYAIYSQARREILIPCSPETGIPFVVLLAILAYKIETEKETDRKFNEFFDSGCSAEWKTANKLDWMTDNYGIRKGIETTSAYFMELAQQNEVFTIRKQTMKEECVLPMSETPMFRDVFKAASTAREFEVAQDKILEARRAEKALEAAEALKTRVESQKPFMDVPEDLKSMIPKEEDVNKLLLTKWHYALARAVSRPFVPARVSLLMGPSGTGKSSVCEWVAHATKSPYWAPFEFGPNTTEEALFGSHRFVNGVPQYIMSNIMKCAKYGGIVELQEVAICRDPAVMVALNNVFEPHGKIRIDETGEEFELNKNARFILTTNLDYAGCKAINKSVRNRSIFTFYVPELTEDEYTERVQSIAPEIKMEKSYIKQMAGCFINLINYTMKAGCDEEGSFRTFLAWVAQTYDCGDPLEAANYTIIDQLCFENNPNVKKDLRSKIQNMLQNKPQIIYVESEQTEAISAE